MMAKKYSQSGQVLLITLLVLTITTTIALSLIGRTTSDESVGRQIEESARAFSAAEAGIEDALRSGVGGTQVLTSGPNYSVTLASIGGAAGVLQYPRKSAKGTTETLWLVAHNTDGTLNETPTVTDPSMTICWTSESITPALGVGILYKESTDGTYKIAKLALDPDAARAATNKFTSVGAVGSACGLSNVYQKTITFADYGITPALDTLLALRVRPIYSDTQLAIDAGASALPLQGNKIESVGTAQGGVSRKVVVYQQYRAPESIFDAGIISQSSFGH